MHYNSQLAGSRKIFRAMSQTATQPTSMINLIISGTPAGVGPVKAGGKLEGHVDGVGDLTVTYAR